MVNMGAVAMVISFEMLFHQVMRSGQSVSTPELVPTRYTPPNRGLFKHMTVISTVLLDILLCCIF